MECAQLFVAAKEGDIATIEILIFAKYIDVNSRTLGWFDGDTSQVIIISIIMYIKGALYHPCMASRLFSNLIFLAIDGAVIANLFYLGKLFVLFTLIQT